MVFIAMIIINVVVRMKGQMRDCDKIEDFICSVREICGYSSINKHDCSVFCYGDCFSASKKKLNGIPHRRNYFYPLYHICIPWYSYLVYLLPHLIFWVYFDYYFNWVLCIKFDTLLLLLFYGHYTNIGKDTPPQTLYLEDVNRDMSQLQEMLHNNTNNNALTDLESKLSVIVKHDKPWRANKTNKNKNWR